MRLTTILTLALVVCATIGATARAGEFPKRRVGTTLYWEEEGYKEVLVDDEIYKKRKYQGIIPSIKDSFKSSKKASAESKWTTLTWVGFQPKKLISRVFIQTDKLATYTVTQPDPLHIHVDIPSCKIKKHNNQRTIWTFGFPTKVDNIKIKTFKKDGTKGVRVVITLGEKSGFLYSQEGNYIYVDVER